MGVVPLTEVFAFQITDIIAWIDWAQLSPKPDSYTAKGEKGEAHHFNQADLDRYKPEVGQFVVKWEGGAIVFCSEEDFKCDFAHLSGHRYATAQRLSFLKKDELPMENPSLVLIMPDLYNHDGTLNEDALDERTRRMRARQTRGITVWMEGYQCTGESSKAQLVGIVYEVDSFKAACEKLAEQLPERSWGADRSTIWGCRLFDNEADARKSYG